MSRGMALGVSSMNLKVWAQMTVVSRKTRGVAASPAPRGVAAAGVVKILLGRELLDPRKAGAGHHQWAAHCH